MWSNPQETTADLVTFTEEILNGKFHFLCSVHYCTFRFIKDFTPNSAEYFQRFHCKQYSILLENKFRTVLNFPWDSNTNCWHLSGNSFQTEFHIIRELVPNKVQCYHRFHSKQYLILSVISFQKVLNCIWEFTSNSI